MTDKTPELQDREIDVQNPETLQAFKLIEQWHNHGLAQVNTLLDNAKAGVELKFGNEPTDADFVLNEDTAKGLRVGLILALSSLGKLPFELTFNEAKEEEGDDQPA